MIYKLKLNELKALFWALNMIELLIVIVDIQLDTISLLCSLDDYSTHMNFVEIKLKKKLKKSKNILISSAIFILG